MLPYAHACFHDVDYIVAQLLAFLDDVHIHRADGVCVEVVVDIVDVLALQLVAVVVDFVLDVEGTVGIGVALVPYESHVHLREGIVGKLHHLVHVLILGRDEVLLALAAAVDGSCDVVTAVADALDLGNLTEHGADLGFRLVA